MSAKWFSSMSDKRQAYADRRAKKERQRLTAKIEKLKARQTALQEKLSAAGDSEKTLRKNLAAVERRLERLELGAYYYKRKKNDEASERKKKRKEARRQAKLSGIDAQLAQCKTSNNEGKKQRLQKRRHLVEVGRIGLRREKAAVLQTQLDDLQKKLTDKNREITYEKTLGAADPKTLKRLQRQKGRLEKKERGMKDRIHVLYRTHFVTLQRRKSIVGFSFVLPWVIGFAVLFLYPLIKTLQLSVGEIADFQHYTIEFTGFSHFSRILFEETDVLAMLLSVLKNSFINMILISVFAFYIATLLNRRIRFRGMFRVICFLPVMLGTGFVMQQLMSQNISQSSLQAVMDFLLPKEIVTYIGPKVTNAVVFFLNRLTVVLWHAGVQILIFLSGLQSISNSLYEAARVDGANEWENLWFITIPQMTPMILLNLVYTVVDTFNDSGNDIIRYMQQYAFEYNQFSYAAAMGVFFMLFALLLVGFVFLIMHPFTKNIKS